MNESHPLKSVAAWALLACVMAGCATKPVKKAGDYTFFPPAPDEPRVQYLTSFGAESDLGRGSVFADFVIGDQRMHRPIWKPYGVAVTKGALYICDTQPGNLTIIDLVKKKFSYVRPSGREALGTPINVAVDKNDIRYITDTKRGQVLAFDKNGQLVAEIGKKNEMKPCGITIAGDCLYITDLLNHCVRVVNASTRELVLTIPADAKNPKGKLFAPTNVTVDDAGEIYVADSGGFAVQVYDGKGNYQRTIGEQGLEAGRFAMPKGVAVDKERRVYVVDAATAVVQLFDDKGRLLMYFGEPKSSGPGGLYLPAGIAVDYENISYYQQFAAPGYTIDHLIFVTNQAGPQKVSVYGFLRKG